MHSLRILKNIKPATTCSLQRLLSANTREKRLPSHAEIVIAGGGAVGSSIAYHLAKCGWKDILLLEQGEAGCGTTWHAAGLCGTLRGTKALIDLALYANSIYASQLEEETGVCTGFKQCGSLNVASTRDRAIAYKRNAVLARDCGVECYIVSPKEAGELNPFLNTEDLEMALWLPNDGLINPTDLVQAYLKGATKDGATTYVDGVQVKAVESNSSQVTAVLTDFGVVSCDKFINSTGLWARELGLKSNPPVEIPLHACQHFYIVTKPIENMHSMLPVTRDYDNFTYLREWSGGLLGGGFEPNAKGTFFNGIPEKFHFQLLEENWEQFEVLMNGLLHRYPCFNNAEIRNFTNGPESFTPDGMPYVGKAMEFSNYYIAAGFNSNGIINSAGVGRCLSELITHGDSELNMSMFDIRRVPPCSNNKLFCHDKAEQTLSSMYTMSYPKAISDGDSVMNSPIHCLLDNAGAVWGKVGEWARPLYFKSSKEDKHVNGFGQPSWLHNVQAELKSCDESIGIIDLSSNSKFNLTCDDSRSLTELLESTCMFEGFNQMRSGDVIQTIVHNTKQSLVSMVDIFRVNEKKFTLVTEANQFTYLLSHLQDIIGNTSGIAVESITGKYAALGLLGAKAEHVLNDLLSPPFTTKAIGKGECHPVDIGYATCVQLSHHFMKGIEGWQLFIPTESSQGLYKMLMRAGEKYNIHNIGNITLDSLRVHHMIPKYGSEIGPRTDKAMLAYLYQGEKRNGVSLMSLEVTIPTSDNWVWGGETVLIGGDVVGNLSLIGYTGEKNKVRGLLISNKCQVGVGESASVMVGEDQYSAKIIAVH